MFKIVSEDLDKYLSDSDIERLAKGYCESLEEVLKHKNPNGVANTHPRVIENLCSQLKRIRDGNVENILCLALNEHNIPIGFITGGHKENREWYSGDIYVEKEYRRSTAGMQMYKEFENIAKRKSHRIFL